MKIDSGTNAALTRLPVRARHGVVTIRSSEFDHLRGLITIERNLVWQFSRLSSRVAVGLLSFLFWSFNLDCLAIRQKNRDILFRF
jgi:hypothetical protein